MSARDFEVPLEVIACEKALLDSLRRAKGSASESQKNSSAQQKADDMLSREIPKGVTLRNFLIVLHNIAGRKPHEGDLVETPEVLRRFLKKWLGHETTVLDFDTAHLLEEQAEAEADVAEATFRIERSGQALQRLRRARAQYNLRAEQQLKSAESMLLRCTMADKKGERIIGGAA